jgi:hypothetical protein
MTTVTKEYGRAWYHKQTQNPEFRRRRTIITARRKEKLRKWYQEYKNTQRCKICGEICRVCLDFHHIDPLQKDIAVSQMIENGYSKLRIEKEISKCVVLCRNCHAKFHAGLVQW